MVELCPNHPQSALALSRCHRCGRSFCPDCLVSFRGGLYDACCKDATLRDFAASSVQTSAFKIASVWARLGAAVIDLFVVLIPIGPVIYAGYRLSGVPFENFVDSSSWQSWATNAFTAVIWTLYEAILVTLRGATVGKSVAGLRVVNLDGSPVRAPGAWSRAVSKYVFNLTQWVGVADTLMIFTRQRRTLDDRIAKTLVVEASSVAPR